MVSEQVTELGELGVEGVLDAVEAWHVAQATRELSVEAAGLVDAGVVTYADGRISWSRFETLVAAKVVEADPQAAAEKERAAASGAGPPDITIDIIPGTPGIELVYHHGHVA